MKMSTGFGGNFTINASVVDQISKRQDICQVSSKNPTTPLAFILVVLLFINCFSIITTKIASEGEGHKPSSDREHYIAESEFALLGILSKNV